MEYAHVELLSATPLYKNANQSIIEKIVMK